MKRKETQQFKAFSYKDITKREKTSLDIFWLKDKSFDDLDALGTPKAITADIASNLQSALDSINQLSVLLKKDKH